MTSEGTTPLAEPAGPSLEEEERGLPCADEGACLDIARFAPIVRLRCISDFPAYLEPR